MIVSIEQFLEQVARRGSWLGGGSVAALSAAMAAALLQKLVIRKASVRRLKRLRRASLLLIDRDARTFAKAIAATRLGNRRRFVAALKQATEVPFCVFANAHQVIAMGLAEKRAIKPQFQSDVRCALAAAWAAAGSAQALILTNLAWMKDAAYARRMRKRLKQAAQHAG